MRYLRFIVAPVALSLVFAYLLPSAGVTLAAGAMGMVSAVVLGIAYCAFFAGYRHVEHWFVSRFATDQVQAHNICQISVLVAMGLVAGSLFGVQWLLPQYLQLAGWAPAVLSGFWLGVVGLSLTPSPALVRSFRQPSTGEDTSTKSEPAPEPAPAPPEDKGPSAESGPSTETPPGPSAEGDQLA